MTVATATRHLVRPASAQPALLRGQQHACRTFAHSRAAGTSETRPDAKQAADALAQAASQGKAPVMWNEYLQLRKQRRVAGLITTWPTSILAALGSGAYLSSHELPFTFAGLDPMILSGIGVLVATGSGLLAGPVIGTTIWAWINRSKANTIAQKDKAFFEHIRRNRVDPSMQSVQVRVV